MHRGEAAIKCPKCGAELDDYTEADLASGRCPHCGTQALGAGMEEGELVEMASEARNIAVETVQDLLGKTIGNCKIDKVLGTGGMGVVFKAHHLALDKTVALKILPGVLARSGGGHIERFLTEARAAARIEHPNIVQVFDINEDAGYYYIIMQYVNGPDLFRLVAERGPLDADLALTIVQQTALALHEIHRAGVIHRDIKPTNILISRSGQVKITDLGLAKFRAGPSDSGISDTNIVLGTPDYMAPEQAVKGGASVDERSDIYSLGATFYFLLTARPPFSGETAVSVIVKHATEPLVSPRMINPRVPTKVARLVERMMAKRPEGRYQTAAELLGALQAAEAQISQGPSGAEPYTFRRSSLRQNAFLAATALQRGLIEPWQVLEALSVQKELVAFGSPRPLSEILVEKGYLGTEALEALLDDYRKRERERVNSLFGRIAVANGLIDRAALADALARQAEEVRSGREVLIGKVLMDSGAMTAEHIRAVLRRQGELQRSADESFFEAEAVKRGVPGAQVADCLDALAEFDPEEEQTLVGLLVDAGHIDAEAAQEMVAAQVRQLIESLGADKEAKVIPTDVEAGPGVKLEEAAEVHIGPTPTFEDSGLEEIVECPHCQAEVPSSSFVCPECGATLGPVPTPAATPAVGGAGPAAKAAKAAPAGAPAAGGPMGRWGYLSGDAGTDDGLAHDDMVRLVKEGAIAEDTTVRGPGTGRQWVFAGRAPGIAKYLGLCPHCQGPVSPGDQICIHCDRFLDVPDAAADLPRAGEGAVAKLRRWLHH